MATTKPCADELRIGDLEEQQHRLSQLDSSDSFLQMVSYNHSSTLKSKSDSYCFDFQADKPLLTANSEENAFSWERTSNSIAYQ